MKIPKCPFCNGECTMQTSDFDGWEYWHNYECNNCHCLFREVYRMKLDKVETLISPNRRADNGKNKAVSVLQGE